MHKNTRAGLIESIEYAVTDETEGRRALRALIAAFRTRRERVPEASLVYFDTFDWRLYRRGFRLATRSRDGSKTLRLQSREYSLEAPIGKKAAPSFAPRLPEGPLKRLIIPVVGVRRLLPLVKLATRSQGIRILDGEEKTVARVQLVHAGATPPTSRRAPNALPPRLTVTPIRGYPEVAERVTRYLNVELGLTRAPSGSFEQALASVDKQPGSYSSKLDLSLDPNSSAGESVRLICLHLLNTMTANEDGVRGDLDSEFLHDFRVAGRRTRSALAQLKHAFDPQARRIFHAEFKWLGSVTGPVRDLDVYLMQMDQYRAALPAGVASDLEPLATYLRQHRETALRALKAALDSPRYRQLVGEWRDYLQAPLPAPERSSDAHGPVAEVASRQIWRAYRKVAEQGASIDNDSQADALHKLRIKCKKLRYLLEFFHSLYPKNAVQSITKSLKQLQDYLGDFNDLEVQQATLQRFAREMSEEGLASVDCLLAMGRLQGHHDQRKKVERQRFIQCFEEFDATRNKKRFTRLFKSPTGNG